MKKISFLILLLISSITSAQEILTLEECYELAEENYPLASQLTLLEEKTARELEVIQKDYLPKIDLKCKSYLSVRCHRNTNGSSGTVDRIY